MLEETRRRRVLEVVSRGNGAIHPGSKLLQLPFAKGTVVRGEVVQERPDNVVTGPLVIDTVYKTVLGGRSLLAPDILERREDLA